jgi:hypothetical protein
MPLVGELTPNLPMMSEGIKHAAHSPAMLLRHRMNFSRASLSSPKENGVRIFNSEDHSNSTATERFRTEIAMLGRLVT